MRAPLQCVRGTRDWLPNDYRLFRQLTRKAEELCAAFGYEMVATPVLEHAELFQRSLGDSSDVVHKEMFIVQHSSGPGSSPSSPSLPSSPTTSSSSPSDAELLLALRPEMTASVVRMYGEAVSGQKLPPPRLAPTRLMYHGPMFRHERPQKGRLRQFHQFGVECFGIDGPHADVEIMEMGCLFLHKALEDIPGGRPRLRLSINTLGDGETRHRYRQDLSKFLQKFRADLSPDSQMRLDRGAVLRILDTKSAADREILLNAPSLSEALSPPALARFQTVMDMLHASPVLSFLEHQQQCPVTVHHNPQLVRGLDYYTHTCFEFTVEAPAVGTGGSLGSQDTVLAGGRYDGLFSQLYPDHRLAPSVPAVGWAAGLERLVLLLSHGQGTATGGPRRQHPLLVVAAADRGWVWTLRRELQARSLTAAVVADSGESHIHSLITGRKDEVASRSDLKQLLRKADRLQAEGVVFDSDSRRGTLIYKSLREGTQTPEMQPDEMTRFLLARVAHSSDDRNTCPESPL